MSNSEYKYYRWIDTSYGYIIIKVKIIDDRIVGTVVLSNSTYLPVGYYSNGWIKEYIEEYKELND